MVVFADAACVGIVSVAPASPVYYVILFTRSEQVFELQAGRAR